MYYSIFSFICMFCRWFFVLFLLAIVLSVLLWFTDSDYLPLVSSNSLSHGFTQQNLPILFVIIWNPSSVRFHTQKSLSHLNQNFQECSINGSEKALPWSCSDPKSNMAATGHFLIGWNINLYFFLYTIKIQEIKTSFSLLNIVFMSFLIFLFLMMK